MDAVTLAAANAAAAKSFAYLLPRSNGTDDLAAIQAILDKATSGPIRVQGRPGQTYVLSDAMVIRSNTTLDMTGCTINGSAAHNLLKNAACSPSRTVTDAVTTASSTTVTSATANFTSADVGMAVGVLGAGPKSGLSTAPGSLYGTIVSVTNATTAVLSQAAQSAVSGATLTVFPARDTGIAVFGGTWNGGNRDSVNQSLEGHLLRFRRVDGLTVRNLALTSTGTSHIGGRYSINQGDVTNSRIHDITLSTAGDGVHTQGPASGLVISNIYGITGDDMVAFTGVDGQSQAGSLLGDVEGDIKAVSVSNLYPQGAWRALKITSGLGTGSVSRTIVDFHARAISGFTDQEVVSVIDYAGFTYFDGEIASVSAYSSNALPVVLLAGSSAQNVRLRDLTWPTSGNVPATGIVKVTKPVKSLVIDGLVHRGTNTGTGVGVEVQANVTYLALRNLLVEDNPPTFHGVDVGQVNVTIGQLSIVGAHRVAQAGNLINVAQSGANIADVLISNGYQSAGSVFAVSVDNTNTTKVRVSDWRQPAGALVIFQNPGEVNLSNVEIAPSAGAIRANSPAATPVRVRCANVAVTSGTLLSRTATQAVSLTGHSGATADLSMLTPVDQDIVNNTNAALACGTGLAIFHTGGTGNGWKNLYSAATY